MPGEQRALFDVEPDPWELDDQGEQRVAAVVFAEGAPGEFDYLIPDALAGQIAVGKRIRVPLGRGNRLVVGYCVGVDRKPVTRQLKPVQAVIDNEALITPKMLDLTRWIASEYLCSLGKVLETVVPAAVRGQAGTYLATFLSVSTQVAARLTQLKLPPKQLAVVQRLASSEHPVLQATVLKEVGCTSAPIKGLLSKGLIDSEQRRIYRLDGNPEERTTDERPELNDDQRRAVETVVGVLNQGEHRRVLLYGVTGSGKTEVYIRIIEEVIRFGRQAIVLVPEISLTPQTVRRFQSRFRSVAVLHSHLSPTERNWHWQRIARGEVQVVVGCPQRGVCADSAARPDRHR